MLVQVRSLPVKLCISERNVFYIVNSTAFVTFECRHLPKKTSRLFVYSKTFIISFEYVHTDNEKERIFLLFAQIKGSFV